MRVYTIKEAARVSKIGGEALKRACDEGLIKASRVANGRWLITESALEEAMHEGIDFTSVSKRSKKKSAMPAGLKKYLESTKREKKAA